MYFGLKSLFIDGLELLRDLLPSWFSEIKIVLIIHLCKTVSKSVYYVKQECKNTYI